MKDQTKGYYVVVTKKAYKSSEAEGDLCEVGDNIIAYADQTDIENMDTDKIYCSVSCGVHSSISFHIPRKKIKVLTFEAT